MKSVIVTPLFLRPKCKKKEDLSGVSPYASRRSTGKMWESAKVSHKRVFALLTPEIQSYEMAQMLQKPVFALPDCQRMSVNTLLCGTLGLAENDKSSTFCPYTVVAELITELIRFEPEISICNGNSLEFKRESVSVMRDFLLKFPQISLCNGN